MIIKILEFAYKRPIIKASIDDHIEQMVQNWCLCKAALLSKDPKYLHWYHHWAGELCAQLYPGIRKLRRGDIKPKAIPKLVDEVLIEDAGLDDPEEVYDIVEDKMILTEGMPKELCRVAADAFPKEGLPEIQRVYKEDRSPSRYHSELYAKVPLGRF